MWCLISVVLELDLIFIIPHRQLKMLISFFCRRSDLQKTIQQRCLGSAGAHLEDLACGFSSWNAEWLQWRAQLCDNTLIQQSETQTDAQLCDNISRRRTQHKRAENTTQKNKRRGKWKVWPEAVYCKGRVASPKGIDFQINSKRPLTPPLNFRKSCCNFIKFHVQKALFKSPNSARQIFGLKLIPHYLDRVPIWL